MYTEEETRKLEEYDGTKESVIRLSEALNKSQRSVIAKLAKMGRYQTQPRTTKDGKNIISKPDLVAAIEDALDITVPTLVKAGKEDLRLLEMAIARILEIDSATKIIE